MITVRCFLQHAPIEFEPGQLAIDEALRRTREIAGMTEIAEFIHERDAGGG